jgi:hypothetical protein
VAGVFPVRQEVRRGHAALAARLPRTLQLLDDLGGQQLALLVVAQRAKVLLDLLEVGHGLLVQAARPCAAILQPPIAVLLCSGLLLVRHAAM